MVLYVTWINNNMKTVKKIMIIVLVIFSNEINLFSQSVFSFSGNEIATNRTYLDALVSGANDPTNQPFVTKGNVSLTSSDHQYNYNITLQKYNGWDKEPGDFEILSIYNNSTNLLLQLQNANSWIKIPAELRQFTTNDYFIPVSLSNSATALIFMGIRFPSETPKLTIVVLSGNKAKLVFNKEYYIQQIIKEGTTFSMTLRDNIAQWTSEAAAAAATDIYAVYTYKICLENGVLNFAQQ